MPTTETAVAIKERPILFSAPMVRAILEGRKSQTRRVIARQPPSESVLAEICDCSEWGTACGNEWHFRRSTDNRAQWHTPPKYGVPGDRLWVRETWAKPEPGVMSRDHDGSPIYAADLPPNTPTGFGPWKPSIHIPRKYSRITLEITEVRVQRVQEISRDDAVAEGVDYRVCPTFQTEAQLERMVRGVGPTSVTIDYVGGFRKLWDSINASRPGCSWESNPWVWCLSFRRIL